MIDNPGESSPKEENEANIGNDWESLTSDPNEQTSNTPDTTIEQTSNIPNTTIESEGNTAQYEDDTSIGANRTDGEVSQ